MNNFKILMVCTCLTIYGEICNINAMEDKQHSSIGTNIQNNILQYRDENNNIKNIKLPYPEWHAIPNLHEILLKENISIPEELEKLDNNCAANKWPSGLFSGFTTLKKMIETIYDNEHQSNYNEDDPYAWGCRFALDIADELATQAKQLCKYRSNHHIMDCYKNLMHVIYLIGVDQTSKEYTIKVGAITTHSMTFNHITKNKLAEQILHKYVKVVFIDFIKYVLTHVYQKVCTTTIDIDKLTEMYYFITKVKDVNDPSINIYMHSICSMAYNINKNIMKLKEMNNNVKTSNTLNDANNSLEVVQEKIIDEFYSFSSQTNYLIQLITENNILGKDPTIMQGYLPKLQRM